MDKPLSIILEDAKQNIIACINDQHIQPCLMKYIIKDVYDMVVKASEEELQSAKINEAKSVITELEE